MTYLNFIASDKEVILFRPEINKVLKFTEATLILCQALYWDRKSEGNPFYKFKEPCKHQAYRKGDSWLEELGLTRYAFDKGISILSDLELLSFKTDRKTNLPYYTINHEKVENFLKEVYGKKEIAKAEGQLQVVKAKVEGQLSYTTETNSTSTKKENEQILQDFVLDEVRKNLIQKQYNLTDEEIELTLMNFKEDPKYKDNIPRNISQTFINWLRNEWVAKSALEAKIKTQKVMQDKSLERVQAYHEAKSSRIENMKKGFSNNKFQGANSKSVVASEEIGRNQSLPEIKKYNYKSVRVYRDDFDTQENFDFYLQELKSQGVGIKAMDFEYSEPDTSAVDQLKSQLAGKFQMVN